MKGDVKRKRFSSELDRAKFAWHPAPPFKLSLIRCEGSHVCVRRRLVSDSCFPSYERIEEEGKQMLDSEVDF
jgi:hypothetical protein